jgi:hypothetical protein
MGLGVLRICVAFSKVRRTFGVADTGLPHGRNAIMNDW